MKPKLTIVRTPAKREVLELEPTSVRRSNDWRYAVDDAEKWERFKATIKAMGVIEPVIVGRDEQGAYFVRTGHRRHKACLELGISMPAIVREGKPSDDVKIAIVENGQRNDLRPAELAEALEACRGDYASATEQANDLGYSVGYVGNLLRIKAKAVPELWELFKRHGEGIDWKALSEVCMLPASQQVAEWNERGASGRTKSATQQRVSARALRTELQVVSGNRGMYWDGYRDALRFAADGSRGSRAASRGVAPEKTKPSMSKAVKRKQRK